MELLVIAGLAWLVYKLASQTPAPPPTTVLESDMSVPVTGSTHVPSPAKSNGKHFVSRPNEIRLRTSHAYVQVLPELPVGNPHKYWNKRKRAIRGGNYMTDADPSTKTMNTAGETPTVPSSDGQKI